MKTKRFSLFSTLKIDEWSFLQISNVTYDDDSFWFTLSFPFYTSSLTKNLLKQDLEYLRNSIFSAFACQNNVISFSHSQLGTHTCSIPQIFMPLVQGIEHEIGQRETRGMYLKICFHNVSYLLNIHNLKGKHASGADCSLELKIFSQNSSLEVHLQCIHSTWKGPLACAMQSSRW